MTSDVKQLDVGRHVVHREVMAAFVPDALLIRTRAVPGWAPQRQCCRFSIAPCMQFSRRKDFKNQSEWRPHPEASMERPTSWYPSQFWIYQVCTTHLAPETVHSSGMQAVHSQH